MGNRQNRVQPTIINPEKFGVSFSLKQCRNFNIEPDITLQFLIENMGFRRFRLMSYWDEHEKTAGVYDFTALDQQFEQLEKAGGIVTLCLGVRQPRWPESHWSNWALELSEDRRNKALYEYIKTVVNRYKSRTCLISYQLENEFLNRSFGQNGNFNRARVQHEMQIVRKSDPARPIIMSTSNTWGIPLRSPQPDQFGFTLYQTQYEKGKYSRNKLPIWWWSLRARLIQLLTGRESFIHELQAEPWGPKAIWEMTSAEQAISMSKVQLRNNIKLARQTGLYPIDLWGGEWWYWRSITDSSTAISDTVATALHDIS